MATQNATQLSAKLESAAAKQMLNMLTLSYGLDLFGQRLEIFAFCKSRIIHGNAVQCL